MLPAGGLAIGTVVSALDLNPRLWSRFGGTRDAVRGYSIPTVFMRFVPVCGCDSSQNLVDPKIRDTYIIEDCLLNDDRLKAYGL